MRLLVIEDERKLAEVLGESLETQGYAVTLAVTGEEGFFLANAHAFDLVLLDLRPFLPRRYGSFERDGRCGAGLGHHTRDRRAAWGSHTSQQRGGEGGGVLHHARQHHAAPCRAARSNKSACGMTTGAGIFEHFLIGDNSANWRHALSPSPLPRAGGRQAGRGESASRNNVMLNIRVVPHRVR
jgi:hypothetical protein